MALSPIERLPTELIQPIFLLSGPNLALPLVSQHIAAKLSEDYIYHAVCKEYLTYNQHSRVEQSKNQTRIFATKWMTWEFFKVFLIKMYEGNGCLCGKTQEKECFDAQWPPDWEDATRMVFSRSHLPELSWVKCRIPVKLLHGPWTSDKIQFLRFLLWITSMTVDWADANVRRIALEGKREAIMERNLEVVEIFNHNRRLGKAPGLAMVRFAVMEAGCDRSIVYDTMATARAWGLRGGGWECAMLDAWCKERIEADDPKGKWLQLKLQELRLMNGPAMAASSNNDGDVREPAWGVMNAESGQYDGGEDDKLVIHKHKWNQCVFDCLYSVSNMPNGAGYSSPTSSSS
ncbi:hypothetical protein K458DRAFT_402487 [Lentithecium fluviatile CBS 122367]|uniref:Uncharacterized protein n=1 Tax=Lentithecium fluviatile CBS 122367 TaxID=1168545 RepID=A0A6G1JA06_9PLEO|nr:hypothetical protein K458DRAFT_402487 [Lentithecium fluviatile CBS 122367]